MLIRKNKTKLPPTHKVGKRHGALFVLFGGSIGHLRFFVSIWIYITILLQSILLRISNYDGRIQMDNTKEKSLIQRYVDAYNAFDIDGMTALLHEEIEFRNISNGEVEVETKGITEFRELAEQSKDIFSERCQTIKQFTTLPNKIEIEIDYEATVAMDLPIGLKAGENLKLEGKSIFEIKDGKLIVIEDYS